MALVIGGFPVVTGLFQIYPAHHPHLLKPPLGGSRTVPSVVSAPLDTPQVFSIIWKSLGYTDQVLLFGMCSVFPLCYLWHIRETKVNMYLSLSFSVCLIVCVLGHVRTVSIRFVSCAGHFLLKTSLIFSVPDHTYTCTTRQSVLDWTFSDKVLIHQMLQHQKGVFSPHFSIEESRVLDGGDLLFGGIY